MIRYAPNPVPRTAQPPCGAVIVSRMAEDMRELAFAGENVSEETLRQRDWPAAIVKRYGPLAARMASRRSVRQTAEG